MILGLLIVELTVIWVIDDTDFIDTIKRWIGLWLDIKVGSLKPLDCSLCSSFWAGILYIIIAGMNWKWIGVVALVSALSKPISAAMRMIRYALETLVAKANEKLDKIWLNGNISD